MNEHPLRVLDELGEELRRLGEHGATRFALTRRTLLTAALLVLLVAGAAAAAILIARGGSLPPPSAADLRSSGIPLASTARLAGLDALDPNPSEPPWDIRLSRTPAGETCSAVGQVVEGRFGIVGLDHVFRTLPLGGVDACGIAASAGPVLAGARVFVGTDPQNARTVVNGVAGGDARSVAVYGPDGARTLHLGPQGSFITVYRGYVEEVRPRISIAMRDGTRHTLAFAQGATFEVPDPSGGSPWTISGGADLEPHAVADENCAQATQELGRGNPSRVDSSLTPEVCGRLGREPLFVLMRRFVPGSGERTGFPWGNSPARTLVYGAVAPRVAALTLTGAGTPRSLAIDRHGGVFLAVLDGHVDPRALSLTARLRDGTVRTFTRSANVYEVRSNRPLSEPPVPAFKLPLPATAAEPGPPAIPISRTVTETLRARDPAGGPDWALRSWQGLPNPHANFGGRPPARFVCDQVGVLDGRTLVAPRAAGSATLVAGEDYGLGGGCTEPSSLARFTASTEAVTYVADPYAYAPRLLRTVVAGLLRADASDPVLVGAGPPRRLALDANHGFLAVLPGSYWDVPLAIRARVGGQTVTSSAVQSFPGPPAPSISQARAPDPDGGAPWGFAVGADGSSAYGRIVDGRLASLDEREGTLRDGPEGWAGGQAVGPKLLGKSEPVVFGVQGGPEFNPPWQAASAPAQPQVERRTLPGRTIITGIGSADVVSVTLATPRDVRTLRPSGPHHVLIAIYDGQFFRGVITATVRLRNGRTVTESVLNPTSGFLEPPPPPSLEARLARDMGTLNGMRAQVTVAKRVSPTRRRTVLHGAPLSMLVEGLHDIEGIVAVEQARLDFIRAHAGILPVE